MFLHRGKIYAIFRVLKVYIFAQGVVHVSSLMIIQIQFTLIRAVLQQLDNIPSFLLALTGVVHVPLQAQTSAVSLFHRNIYHYFENIDFKTLS